MRPRPAFSIPSVLAAICAVISLRSGAAFGLIMAILAIVFGAIGMLLAFLPQTRGGIVSVLSIVFGLIGVIAAVFKLLGGNL
jgi:hypothetical protein